MKISFYHSEFAHSNADLLKFEILFLFQNFPGDIFVFSILSQIFFISSKTCVFPFLPEVDSKTTNHPRSSGRRKREKIPRRKEYAKNLQNSAIYPKRHLCLLATTLFRQLVLLFEFPQFSSRSVKPRLLFHHRERARRFGDSKEKIFPTHFSPEK